MMLELAVMATTLLVGLVAGLVFAFAVVAMPGIGTLPDRQYIRAFQAMDKVIQDNQPLFMLAWVGSAVAMVATVVLGFTQLEGSELVLLLAAAAVYLIGVQLPTVAINIPLNNRIQQVATDAAGEAHLAEERAAFESRWNRWNQIRTVLAVVTMALLLILLLRL